MCECGHTRNDHLAGGARQCTECDCQGFRRDIAVDDYNDTIEDVDRFNESRGGGVW
jgi:hypothetical protein